MLRVGSISIILRWIYGLRCLSITIYIKGFAPLRKMEARKSMSFMSSKMLKQLKSYGWEIFKGKGAFDLDKAIKDVENLLKK